MTPTEQDLERAISDDHKRMVGDIKEAVDACNWPAAIAAIQHVYEFEQFHKETK